MKIKNIFLHLKTICTHKHYVFYYCKKAGIPIQGMIHDLSKFSPTEFFESVKYYQGNRSPIDACKEDKGYSNAWMHHKGRNKHHYEYWVDNFDNGGTPIRMPYKYALELVCDYLGAGKAYQKNKFTYKSELAWWEAKKEKPLAMHPQTIQFVDNMLKALVEHGEGYTFSHAKKLYMNAIIQKSKE